MTSYFRSIGLPFLISLLGIGLPYLVQELEWDRSQPEHRIRHFEEALHEHLGELDDGMEALSRELQDKQAEKLFEEGSKGSDRFFLVYEGDSLRYWSDNALPAPSTYDPDFFSGPLIREGNGVYLLRSTESDGRRIIGLALIKKQYRYENRYLQDRFFHGAGLPPGVELLSREGTAEEEDLYKVEAPGLSEPLHLRYDVKESASSSALWVTASLNLIGILAFLFFLHRLIPLLREKLFNGGELLFPLLLLLLLRQFTLMNHFPAIWHRTELFSPTLYAASDLFPTLGDLLINGLLLLFMGFLVHRHSRSFRFPSAPRLLYPLILLTSVGLMAIGLWTGETVRGLVENSNIFFDLNQPYSLTVYSSIGLFAVACLLFAFFFFADSFLNWTRGERSKLFLGFSIATLFVLLVAPLYSIDAVQATFPPVFTLVLAWAHYRHSGSYSFGHVVLALALVALFTATIFSTSTEIKERQNRRVLAEKLADDEDPVTDLRFNELEERIRKDTVLQEFLRDSLDREMLRKRMERDHFRGFWSEYRVNVHLFGSDGKLLFRLNDGTRRDRNELQELIREKASPTELSEHLHYVHRSPELLNYIGMIPVGEEDALLFVELLSRRVPREVGFPELLLEERTDLFAELRDHSYARYLEGRLVDRSGSYSYRRELDAYSEFEGEERFLVRNGFQHLFYRTGEESAIILSRPVKGKLSLATTFSYLFILFSIVLVLFVSIMDLMRGSANWQLSLKGKLRTLMVGITLASVLIFALVTRYYVRDQYRAKNERQIREKTRSVLLELDDKIGRDPELRPGIKAYTDHILSELSNIFFTDINLYGPEGKLFATSRDRVFEEGLLGPRIHPEAYEALLMNMKSEFVQKERIGEMEHLSAYAPLSNDEGRILGYLNLPYFAKQDELEQELSTFFVAILNIFVLLFALSLLSALFISNWVMRPLRSLQESLSRIELGRSNEPLEYHGKDEIGELVNEYNRKVTELEEKAEALARTERESAWREMAKQVAHEIKNPLTPMRLQLQQLKRSGDAVDPERLRETADRLIERIDALSRIASEFSHFAEMPRAEEERVALLPVVRGTIELYEETPAASIELEEELEEEPYVFVDRDQLARVFSNILSNAVESIPEGQEGRIRVWVGAEGGEWCVSIEDNGKGIPAADRERIFEPNFTTRSRGSGLGLAISKKIVETAGGRIRVDSEEGRGSRFKVLLPKA